MDRAKKGKNVSITSENSKTLDKGQGPAARALDKLPKIVQETIARILGYPHQYPDLDAFTKCIMAVQIKQRRIGFIGDDPIESRRQFDAQMLAILNKPTFIEFVEDIRLPLQSGTVCETLPSST